MLKKVVIVVAAVITILLIFAGFLTLRYRSMTQTITTEAAKVTDVDLSEIPNGDYRGSFGEFLVHIDLEVSVADHRISSIDIIEQKCGPGYEATGTVDRIIAAQSPRVDAITGATGSSYSIMIAVYRALTEKR